jgi:3-hydroxybutyryl-CoA dehydratase
MSQNLQLGQSAFVSKQILLSDLIAFSDLSLDTNPIHIDEEYAKTTQFGRPIAQGLYVASLISAVLANQLPGPGTIYLGQELSFKKPVFVGDTVTATVTVTEILKPGLIRLSTICSNQNGEVVIQGSALVKAPPV